MKQLIDFYVMASLWVEGVGGKPALLSSVLSAPLLPIFQASISARFDTDLCPGRKISTVIALHLPRVRASSPAAHLGIKCISTYTLLTPLESIILAPWVTYFHD